MTRTRIKICGVLRPQDAQAAARCGADAIGLVMYPGALRSVTVERAREIVSILPPFVTPVALFVDASVEEIVRTTSAIGVRQVQLQGREPPELPRSLAGAHDIRVVKAIHVDRTTFCEDLARWSALGDGLSGIVLDTANTGVPGGSGVENDWQYIHQTLTQLDPARLPPLILAGGLNPANVTGLIRSIRPFAVDVSSGVEDSVGMKSEAKINAFCQAVHAGDDSEY